MDDSLSREVTTPELTQAEKNALFEALSVDAKRMVILGDIRAQIIAKRIGVKQQQYLTFRRYQQDRVENLSCEETQKFLCEEDLSEVCSVCAIGAVFITAIKFMNKLSGFKMIAQNEYGMIDYVRDVFPANNLRMMEYAFEEGRICKTVGEVTAEEHQGLQRFWAEARTFSFNDQDDQILLMIVENAIENGGLFKPETYVRPTKPAEQPPAESSLQP